MDADGRPTGSITITEKLHRVPVGKLLSLFCLSAGIPIGTLADNLLHSIMLLSEQLENTICLKEFKLFPQHFLLVAAILAEAWEVSMVIHRSALTGSR
jgi:hypothetical protein